MRVAWFMALVLTPGLLLGCETYTERISCSNGTVLDDDGDCVLPPVPDGGVSIETCAELCAMVPDWTSTQVECLQTNLMRTGPLPMDCTVLETREQCDACVVASGVDDLVCGLTVSCL